MVVETNPFVPGVRVIVVANEKGGSGKSTVAIHLAIALTRSGQNAADGRSRFVAAQFHPLHRQQARAGRGSAAAFAADAGACLLRRRERRHRSRDRACAAAGRARRSRRDHNCIVIDTPGHNSEIAATCACRLPTLWSRRSTTASSISTRSRASIRRRSASPTSATMRDWSRRRGRAAAGGQAGHRLDRAAQPALEPQLAQQTPGRRGAAGAFAAARLPLRGRIGRALDLPRVLSARFDGARRAR